MKKFFLLNSGALKITFRSSPGTPILSVFSCRNYLFYFSNIIFFTQNGKLENKHKIINQFAAYEHEHIRSEPPSLLIFSLKIKPDKQTLKTYQYAFVSMGIQSKHIFWSFHMPTPMTKLFLHTP